MVLLCDYTEPQDLVQAARVCQSCSCVTFIKV